jgi:RNA polymerase sigma factor (sigma-70 family)
MTDPVSDETARTLRAAWFQYVDTVADVRPRLHAYCLRMTGTIWDAEDLLQDTLLRGFGTIGRGDLHGAHSRFERPAAYLCQIATNLWIDRMRRNRWQAPAPERENGEAGDEPAVVTPAAGRVLFERTSPQQRAAVVLKDVFDFSLSEVAEILVTTPDAVKSALHRGRENLAQTPEAVPPRHAPASPELIDRFIAAFNARDVAAIVGLLMDGVAWEVQGVGGERGRDAIWLNVDRPEGSVAVRRLIDGIEVVAFTIDAGNKTYLTGLHRIEESEGQIARIVNYHFCPESLARAAERLGLGAWRQPHHQNAETLQRMIAGSVLPWAPPELSATRQGGRHGGR